LSGAIKTLGGSLAGRAARFFFEHPTWQEQQIHRMRACSKMKKLLGLLCLLLLSATVARAQGSYYANSPSFVDVDDCVNGTGTNTCHVGSPTGSQATHTVVNGDVVNVPSGSATWSNVLAAPSNVAFTLIGSGSPQSGSGSSGAASSCAATEIIDNAGNSTSMMQFFPQYGSAVMRVSCMDIEPESSTTLLYNPIRIEGACTSSGCPSFRVDNISAGLNNQWSNGGTGTGSNSGRIVVVNDAFGVLDHNYAPTGNDSELFVAQLQSYLGVGDNGDNSWAQPLSLGGANNVFAENNTWHMQTYSMSDCEAPGPYGCRFVVRYNTIYQANIGGLGIAQNHGTDTGGRNRGGVEMEVYKNTLNIPSTGYPTSVDGGERGGTAIFFGNVGVFASGSGATDWLGISFYRNDFPSDPWGACGGLNSIDPYDQNDNTAHYTGTVGSVSNGNNTATDSGSPGWATNQWNPASGPYSVYDVTQGDAYLGEVGSNTANSITINVAYQANESPWYSSGLFTAGDTYEIIRATACMDAPGRGPGTYVSGTTPTPTGWLSQPIAPIYMMDDTTTGATPNYAAGSNSSFVQNYRDMYLENLSQTAQTSSTSPFSCNGSDSAVGWGTLAHRPTTCSGACSANTLGCGYFATDQGSQGELFVWESGAWALYYTPYTYPHPLDSSSGSVSLSPSSENFGSVNVGSSSSSPFTFTLSNTSGTTATSITVPANGTGGNSGDFSTTNSGAGSCAAAGGTLINGSSCTFTVAFTPGAAGSRSTTLSVSYSGGDGASPQTSSLSGTGASTGNVPPPTNLHVDSIN
jgi:hypothetical protein